MKPVTIALIALILLTSTAAATAAPVPWQIEAAVADQAEG